MYSQTRCKNWAAFDPYESELCAVRRRLTPSCSVAAGDDARCEIYESEVRPAFVRPFTSRDVRDVLREVPPRFLAGMKAVYLLGGTRKQERLAHGRLFCYGLYGEGEIVLHAFPRSNLRERWRRLPRPSVIQEYERSGARFMNTREGYVLVFDENSLRMFFLYDVLLHEVGHHFDHRNRSRRGREPFAEWFAVAERRRQLGL